VKFPDVFQNKKRRKPLNGFRWRLLSLTGIANVNIVYHSQSPMSRLQENHPSNETNNAKDSSHKTAPFKPFYEEIKQ
jgi:hypothetical protein